MLSSNLFSSISASSLLICFFVYSFNTSSLISSALAFLWSNVILLSLAAIEASNANFSFANPVWLTKYSDLKPATCASIAACSLIASFKATCKSILFLFCESSAEDVIPNPSFLDVHLYLLWFVK